MATNRVKQRAAEQKRFRTPLVFRAVTDLRVILVGLHSAMLWAWGFTFDQPGTILFPIVDMPAFALYSAIERVFASFVGLLSSSGDMILCFWFLGNLQWFGIGWLGNRWMRHVFSQPANPAEPDGALCGERGYNLTGNVSGICPECGSTNTTGSD